MATPADHPRPQKVTTFLWFENNNALEAASWYVTLFPDSEIVHSDPLVVTFILAGVKYQALNGGPHYRLTPAVSLYVECEDQAEVDQYWDTFLADGGSSLACGWVQDKFGLSWQVVPKGLQKLINDPDKEKADRTTQAMRSMIKLDIAKLEAAHAGDS